VKLAVYQFAPRFGEWEANLDSVRGAVSGVECDLLVLPELALTGYQFTSREELASLAEPVPGGRTCAALAEIAADKNCHIVCGLPEEADSSFFNRAVLVGPEGFIGTYRKAHLFFEEKLYFTPGDSGFGVFDTGTARIGMIVCFDWLFPEATRVLALRGAQIVVQPANLVLPWCQEVALARSCENRVFFVTANRTGSESRGGKRELRFTGQSQVVTPTGNLLFRLAQDEETLKLVEIDPSVADNKAVTVHNDIFGDRRTELYGPLVE
jgi:predicted amidohydrolase